MSHHHYVVAESWAVIDLDTREGRVLVREKWSYDWKLWPGVLAPWTYQEKRNFHQTGDRQIWSSWSFRVALSVKGTSQFAKDFHRRRIEVNFDIQWVLDGPRHWSVTVWKMPSGSSPTDSHRSFVDVPRRRIELNTADIAPRDAGNDAGQTTGSFKTIPHEFGHASMLGSGGHSANPDEYVSGSPHLKDTSSMMNIGQELRERHLVATVSALNRLAEGASALKNSFFAVSSIHTK